MSADQQADRQIIVTRQHRPGYGRIRDGVETLSLPNFVVERVQDEAQMSGSVETALGRSEVLAHMIGRLLEELVASRALSEDALRRVMEVGGHADIQFAIPPQAPAVDEPCGMTHK